MPGRRDADRPVQQFYRHQRRAAVEIDGVRPSARAPVVNDRDHEQQRGDERRRDGDRHRGRADRSGRRQEGEKPARHRGIQNRDAGQQHQALVQFRPARVGDRQDKDHREEQNAAERDDRKGDPGSASPSAAARFIEVDRGQETEDRHRGRQRHADHPDGSMPCRPPGRREPGLERKIQRPGEEQHAMEMNDRHRGERSLCHRQPVGRCEAEEGDGHAGQRHVEIEIPRVR